VRRNSDEGRGWRIYTVFDFALLASLHRKIVVNFADGDQDNLQIVPRAIWDAKKNGTNLI